MRNDSPTFIREALDTADGAILGARLFLPDRAARATVVIQGATAVPQGYYAAFAGYLASRGLAVLTYDYRGVGASRPARLRGFGATMRDWARYDAPAALRWAKEAFPSIPLVVVGHSFGGQALGLAPGAAEVVDGALLVASQSGDVRYWPSPKRHAIKALWRVVVPAGTSVFGYLPGWMGLGEDLPAGVASEWAGWCMTPGYVTGALPREELHFADVTAPILAYSFPDDTYAPPGSVDALLAWYARAPIEHRRVDPASVGARGIGHFGFFRRALADALWGPATDWILARAGAPGVGLAA
jgi:predicted alpha/beta hydrolase